jgi:hypothetical protein
VCDHLEPLPNAATTDRSSSASKPVATRIVAAPTCTASSAAAIGSGRTSFANLGALAGAFFIHRYALDTEIPSRFATVFTVSPVARTSAISRARSSAVYCLRMPPFGTARYMGSWIGLPSILRSAPGCQGSGGHAPLVAVDDVLRKLTGPARTSAPAD